MRLPKKILPTHIYNQSLTKEVNSGISGYFELKNVAVADTLMISHLGFDDLKVPVSDVYSKACKDYFLTEKRQLLSEVIIKNYLSSGVFIKYDGTIHFDLNNADILTGQAEPDALQSVQLLPGIENPTETASGIFIRGGTPCKQ